LQKLFGLAANGGGLGITQKSEKELGNVLGMIWGRLANVSDLRFSGGS